MDIFILLTKKNIFLDIIRVFLALFDFIVYFVVSLLFRVLYVLANFELVGLYEMFEKRIYIILGIFMIFKVTISLLTYLVNPDEINNKETGASKMLVRIITSLVMLVMLPTAFNLMTELQNHLLPVIPRIIVGESGGQKGGIIDKSEASRISHSMSSTMLKSFFHLDSGEVNGYEVYCDGKEISNEAEILVNVNEKCSGDDDYYAYDYLPIISTVVGVAACIVLVSLNISVAIRAFKLIILRMIAPIPIVSYMDPKSAKNGGMFDTWVKTFASTWAEVFIYVGIIYFVTFMIDFMLSGGFWKGFFSSTENPLDGAALLVFLILGLLYFAKQAPKFIFDALGIKNQGGFMKMLALGANAAGMAGSFAAGQKASQLAGGGRLKSFGSGLANALGGGIAGADAIANSKAGDNPFKAGFNAQNARNQTLMAAGEDGSTFGGRMRTLRDRLLSGDSLADSEQRGINREKRAIEDQGREISRIKNRQGNLNAIASFVKDEMPKQRWTQGNAGSYTNGVWSGLTDVFGSAVDGTINYKDFMALKNAAASRGETSFNIMTSNGWREITMEDANLYEGDIMASNEADYYAHASNSNDTHYDSDLGSIINEAINSGVSQTDVANRKAYKQAIKDVNVEARTAERAKQEAEVHMSDRERANAVNKANDKYAGKTGGK